ncbi:MULTISPECIES: barstar family protein [unclassified Psychrobacter]|uniref:barstar family protein n=1 Tax=unclassified Psychrobacter TaxID=196806 RepID=UPI000760E192|nr:barstar family protein [Psychrobacter sp. P11F6]
MSKAIYYINLGFDQDINQKTTALNASMPAQTVNIPVDEILNKATLLTNLANACDFPSYFSHNWDSAWDCLTDSEVTHLMLDLTAVKKINTEDFNVFKSIIEDAYRDFGKPQLWVIMPSVDDA